MWAYYRSELIMKFQAITGNTKLLLPRFSPFQAKLDWPVTVERQNGEGMMDKIDDTGATSRRICSYPTKDGPDVMHSMCMLTVVVYMYKYILHHQQLHVTYKWWWSKTETSQTINFERWDQKKNEVVA